MKIYRMFLSSTDSAGPLIGLPNHECVTGVKITSVFVEILATSKTDALSKFHERGFVDTFYETLVSNCREVHVHVLRPDGSTVSFEEFEDD